MKRQIRRGVFETNSSSCHSLSIENIRNNCDYDQLKKYVNDYDNTIHVGFGEFGWEQECYIDAFTKLEYALTMIVQTECGNVKDVEDFYETDGFVELNELIKSRCHCDGITLTSKMELVEYHPNVWVEEKKRWLEDYDVTDFYINHEGYIDHQSRYYKSLQDFYL